MATVTQKRLTFEFKKAVRTAHYHGPRLSYAEMASRSGFPDEKCLTQALNAPRVSYSARTIYRFDALARLIGHPTEDIWMPVNHHKPRYKSWLYRGESGE